jgi:integrase
MRRTPGTGSVFHPRFRDRTGATRKGRLLWISYTLPGGREKREPARTANRREAEDLLRRRLGAVDRGDLPAIGRPTWETLADIVTNDYKANGRRSLKRLEQSLAHLGKRWRGQRADSITADRITAYAAARLEEGAARATVNRELAALKRALRLAVRAGRLAIVPYVGLLKEQNARRGFFEAEAFAAVLAHLPGPERLVCEVAYVTGWRISSEILTRQWRHLDLKAGWLRLEPGETKNGEGRQFPLTPHLQVLLDQQRALTQQLEQGGSRVIPWVFHREGRPIRSFRRS